VTKPWGAVLLREQRRKLREGIETSKARERTAKDELALAKSSCEALTRGCNKAALDERCRHVLERCAVILDRLRRRIKGEVATRAGHRLNLRATAPAGQKRQAELRRQSDDQALHEIPAELHGLWRREKHRYPYRLQSDERAHRFVEWAGQNPSLVREYLEQHWDKLERDIIAEAEERDRREQEEHDAVPF